MEESQRSEAMRSRYSDLQQVSVNGEGKSDVMINLSLSPEQSPRTRTPMARSHLRSRSLAGIPGMPSMTRVWSTPGLDSHGRYIFVNGREVPASAVDGTKRLFPSQMRDDHIETRLGSLNISETISENAELETAPMSPTSSRGSSPVPMQQHFIRVGRMRSTSPLSFQQPITSFPSPHASPVLSSRFNESYPSNSNSTTSSVPSTPTSLRSRSPSISSLETIADIPDAEAEALEEEDRIAKLKAAADADDEDNNMNGRRAVDYSPSNSFNTMRVGSNTYRSDKRKRWSVCGAERRQDLDLETIWED